LRTDVHEIARLLHRHDALACFDYAAAAPYVDIDMNPRSDPDAGLDAVYLSPHKFVGGPGSCGLLVFNERLYDGTLPPTISGGGTVTYVGLTEQDYVSDIETRESAGTPAVLQTIKAAMALEVRRRVGVERIEARERELICHALGIWSENAAIEILGNDDPERRLGIVSFNIRSPDGRYLHHGLVATLLNDLFGIQARSGCSCAGPYGHRLLGIDATRSEEYRAAVRAGHIGIKPGWCRVSLHWLMDDAEADYLIDAIEFIARHGRLFLCLYHFDWTTGAWSHHTWKPPAATVSLDAALRSGGAPASARTEAERRRRYNQCLMEAGLLADELREITECRTSDDRLPDLEPLRFFTLDR
jgi:selenocysteine lyase/cysteine desulfurase